MFPEDQLLQLENNLKKMPEILAVMVDTTRMTNLYQEQLKQEIEKLKFRNAELEVVVDIYKEEHRVDQKTIEEIIEDNNSLTAKCKSLYQENLLLELDYCNLLKESGISAESDSEEYAAVLEFLNSPDNVQDAVADVEHNDLESESVESEYSSTNKRLRLS